MEIQVRDNSGVAPDREPERLQSLGEPGPRFISTSEAAAALELSVRTIRRAIARGNLQAVKEQAAYRINAESLARFAAQTRRTTGPRPLARVVAFPNSTETLPLPEPLSSFVGRGADLAAVLALLDAAAPRLITLTGPGGIGKTRLALAAASAAASDRFPDGIVFILLADVYSPEFVMPSIAQALGLREQPGLDQAEQLRTYLRRKQLLLLLDNFEQILLAGADVATLLADAPAVKALVTSRAPLRVTGERALVVQPMTLAGAGATLAELLASDAGRLFAERAREHDSSFRVDEESAPLIASICTRLDGLPLAIELAAARVKILPPRQLHARLERRLPLLTRGVRNAPARHKTMRDAIAWSYDLLTPSQQRCFRRLAVFSGGATIAAAMALCGDADDVIDVVADLIDQGLLMFESGFDGERRFRMLETIREFGLEQLAASGDENDVRSLHAHFFLALSRALRPLASTHASSEPFATLAAEYSNLQETLSWLETNGPAGAFVELVADLCEYWYASSFGREAGEWIERATAKLAQAAMSDQARLMVGHAAVLLEQGKFAQAEPLLAHGLHLLRVVGDPLYISRALIFRGAVLSMNGRYVEAEEPLREALALAEELPDPDLRAASAGRALSNLCVAARGQADFARATAYGEESLRLYEGQTFDPVRAMSLIDLGAVAYDRGEHGLALDRLLEGITLMGERGDMRQVADALSGIACIATAWGDCHAALRIFGAADALRERVGAAMVWPTDIAAVKQSLASLRTTLGEQAVAETLAAGRELSVAESLTQASALTAPAAVLSRDAARSIGQLTRRDREVLRLLVEYRTDREIAEALFLSPRTANWHVRSILAKLGVASRREAAARAGADRLI